MTYLDKLRVMPADELAQHLDCPLDTGLIKHDVPCPKDDTCDCERCIRYFLNLEVK